MASGNRQGFTLPFFVSSFLGLFYCQEFFFCRDISSTILVRCRFIVSSFFGLGVLLFK